MITQYPQLFFNWLTLDHRWYSRFLRKSWKIKRIAEKYRQDLQQLSCRDLLYKGQTTEELSVNIHFIHSSNTLNGHICVWCFLCSSIWKIKIFTPRRLQQAQMSSRQLWAFGGIQQTNINWIGTEQKHQKIAGTDSTLQSTRYWTGILMLLQLGKTTDVEPQPQPQPRASNRYVLSSGLYTLCYKFYHIVQSWNRLLKI